MNRRQIYLVLILFFLHFKSFGYQESTIQQEKLNSLDELEIYMFVTFDDSYHTVSTLLGKSSIFFSFYEIINILEMPIERKEDNLLNVYYKNYKNPFVFNFETKEMIIKGVKSTINTDNFVISKQGEVYVKPQFFEELFGLFIEYLKKDVSAILKTKDKSPKEIRLLRESRLTRMTKKRPLGTQSFDTIYYFNQKKINLFNYVSYNIGLNNSSNRKSTYYMYTNTRHSLLGGDLKLIYQYFSNATVRNFSNNFFINWKNNYNSKILKTLEIGEVEDLGFSVFAQTNKNYGIAFSNKNNNNRVYKEQEITGYASPNTPIELYVRGKLIDYQYSNLEGYYSFKFTPTQFKPYITLKFVDDSGNLIERTKNFSLPTSQNDKNQLTYNSFFTISDQSLDNGLKMDYGITRGITSFAGIQSNYNLESNTSFLLPYYGVRAIFFNENLFINSTYKQGATFDFNFNLSLKDYGSFSGLYSSIFEENELLILPDFQENLSLNYRKRFTLLKKLSVSLNLENRSRKELVFTNVTNADFRFSTRFSKFRLGYSRRINDVFSNENQSLNSSTFNLGVNPKRNLSVYLNYSHAKNSFFRVGNLNIQYNKHSFSSRLSAGYRPYSKSLTFNVSLRYNFSSFTMTSQAGYINNTFSNNNVLSGRHDLRNGGGKSKSNNIGKSGVLLIPYLDKNNNGKKDHKEPMIKGLNTYVKGIHRELLKNGSIYLHNMEPGTLYAIKLDEGNIKNIYHQSKYKVIGAKTSVGNYTRILLPFREVGEIEGNVSFNKGNRPLRISIYDTDDTLITKIPIEPDGYFSYLGLVPGKYYLKINIKGKDTDYTITPFELLPNKEGAYLGGLKIKF